MASLVKNIAKEYDSSKSYSYGDYTIYDKMLYMCISSTTGTFDSECWEEKYLTDVMNGKSDYYDADYIAPIYDSTKTYNTDDAVIYDGVLFICKEDNVTGTFNVRKWNKSSIVECGDMSASGKLLWSNSSPSTSFAGGTELTLDLTNYDLISVEYQESTTSTTKFETVIIKGIYALLGKAGTSDVLFRDVFFTDSLVHFGNGNRVVSTSSTLNNIYIIPTAIKGIKCK